MTFHHLFEFTLLLVLVLGVWQYTRRHPLVALIAGCGIAVGLSWLGSHPVLTIAALAAGIAYWRSDRVRRFVRHLVELIAVGAWFLTGFRDELRGARSQLRRLQLRILRKIRAHCRAGVFGEKQLPTTALVEMHIDDYAVLAPVLEATERELEEELRHRSEVVRLMGAPAILIRPARDVRKGWPRVRVTFSAETAYDDQLHPVDATKLKLDAKLLRVDAPGEVLATGRLVIGRDPAQATVIVSDDPHVSRAHATVSAETDGHFVVDGGSLNGTFVNGTQIFGRHELRHGDQIRLGRTVTYEFSDVGEATTMTNRS